MLFLALFIKGAWLPLTNFFFKAFWTILENSLVKIENFWSGSSDYSEKLVLIKSSINFDSSITSVVYSFCAKSGKVWFEEGTYDFMKGL